MAQPNRILDLFIPVRQLGRGGMGAVFEVIADIQAERFPLFLADMIAWREATDPSLFGEAYKKVHDAKNNLARLAEKEIQLQDQNASPNEIARVQKKIAGEKDGLKIAVYSLQREQADYVTKRHAVLSGENPERLSDLLDNFGVKLPPDLRFALKISMAPVSQDDTELKRLQDEWKSLIALDHENIVSVYSGGVNYYVMEFIRNQLPPRQIIQEFTIAQKIGIVQEAARGMAHAHGMGVIHRDIKPDNLFTFETKGGPKTKVGDFGLAKTDYGLTITGTIAGTVHFMSPEQVHNSKNCTELSDIYSLGATLYAFITGVPPFQKPGENASFFDLQKRIVEEPVPKPSKILPSIPPELEEMILAMMEKNPSQRPQSMNEVDTLLQMYLAGEDQKTLMMPTFVEIPKRERGSRMKIRKRQRLEEEIPPPPASFGKPPPVSSPGPQNVLPSKSQEKARAPEKPHKELPRQTPPASIGKSRTEKTPNAPTPNVPKPIMPKPNASLEVQKKPGKTETVPPKHKEGTIVSKPKEIPKEVPQKEPAQEGKWSRRFFWLFLLLAALGFYLYAEGFWEHPGDLWSRPGRLLGGLKKLGGDILRLLERLLDLIP